MCRPFLGRRTLTSRLAGLHSGHCRRAPVWNAIKHLKKGVSWTRTGDNEWLMPLEAAFCNALYAGPEGANAVCVYVCMCEGRCASWFEARVAVGP